MTVSEFARRVGVSEGAVRKGIKNGRLESSIGYDQHGRPMITDVALAEREWRDNYDPSRVR